jgi:hypoxanthine phosphoribosyltransferase
MEELTAFKALGYGEEEFFRRYSWVVNPYLTFMDLLVQMNSELDMQPSLTKEWEKEESLTNLYIFACAINCSLEDFLLHRHWYIEPLSRYFPHFSSSLQKLQRLLNFPSGITVGVKFKRFWEWKSGWDFVTELICSLLIDRRQIEADDVGRIKKQISSFRLLNVPHKLATSRMKLNEGFRCQDLSYHDMFTLVERFLRDVSNKAGKFVIVGARTAGSYLAPLAKVYLERNGVKNVSWITVRPKLGLHERERMWLRKNLTGDVNVILADDYSNTGDTFRRLERLVESFGVSPKRITMLAPIHPHMPKKHIPSDAQVRVITLTHDDLFRKEMMEPQNVESVLKSCSLAEHAVSLSVLDDNETEVTNRKLWSHYGDSYQVRLKRVYKVIIKNDDGIVVQKKILGKSVGLGWLGYHAYLAGVALKDFVPQVITLRHGVLFEEWLDGQVLTPDGVTDEVVQRMAAYLAQRTKSLSLNEDPKSVRPHLGWGWLEILAMLRQVYNNLLGYLKYDYLLERLKRLLHQRHVLVDGRMRPDEWIETRYGLFKMDFEHHNFGEPELEVVDPAYDIAITSFEFSLDEGKELKLIAEYSSLSGDSETLGERIFLYKLLYGTAESERMFHRLSGASPRTEKLVFHERSVRSWNYRVFSMNGFLGTLLNTLTKVVPPQCPKGLFFMDIDGVFDTETLGFPHTTPSGLIAVALLHSHGFRVIPDTGRGIEHLKNYCASYGLSAGIGEYGSVLYDNVRKVEIPLIDEPALNILELCRRKVSELDGVFIDPNYRYSVRAYRYGPNGICGLGRDETRFVLEGIGLRGVKIILKNSDTYFVSGTVDKGKAIELYKEYSGLPEGMTIAVGDSLEDISMFESVSRAYAPVNCAPEIKRCAKLKKCTIVPYPGQKGLLEISKRVTGCTDDDAILKSFGSLDDNSFAGFLIKLLNTAESSKYRRFLSVLSSL